MKLKFKEQAYQANAVNAVIACFKGQTNTNDNTYRIDPGKCKNKKLVQASLHQDINEGIGFKNSSLGISEIQILKNIQEVQKNQNLKESPSLVTTNISRINLDVEMETGTGKTYCYIKTMFEMNKLFGWNKFIIVVPSIAIREGIYKSLQITADHFQEKYHKRIKFFIYSSKQLNELESFSSDAGINVMVINVQAFNATGKDNRRIYEELDNFQSRRPIDVISANRPILILDEPQKMEGTKTLNSLIAFKPLFILRYSATHKTKHNIIHRLDALDAYNQKLVKKIAVRGISVKGQSGSSPYLYLESIEISKHSPLARIEMEIKQQNNIKRVLRKLSKGDNLHDISNGLDQYKGFVITDIDANKDIVEFAKDGLKLYAGDVYGEVNEMPLRRIQIRETIKAHFAKEQKLYHKGIKVLSLFFIDEVVKYRDYSQEDEKGTYARYFEEEYQHALDELKQNLLIDDAYRQYLETMPVDAVHKGYFAIDKKTKRMLDPETGKKSNETNDVDAYTLILKSKERLLSFNEPTRFIFSHSALREGWDNPNVFVICTLKHSDNTISRRQEVGRGLRIAVDQYGDRQDDPISVHDTNILTVVTNESYSDFVTALQKDIAESLSARPRLANEEYFTGKRFHHDGETLEISPDMATEIYDYLVKNDYVKKHHITEAYHDAQKRETLAPLPEELKPHNDQIFILIDSVFNNAKLPTIDDERVLKTIGTNDNFNKKEFKELWNRINQKSIYTVHFDSDELIKKCIKALDAKLIVEPLQYTLVDGVQHDTVSYDQTKAGEGFKRTKTTTENSKHSIHSNVYYDLIGKICNAEDVKLTRKSIAAILGGIRKDVFMQFATNPESFIAKAINLIKAEKATVIIEHLSYDMLNEKYDSDIFTSGQSKQDFSRAGDKLKRHIYDYVITDSKSERSFVEKLDVSSEVVVYAKLPRGFFIPTPIGNYNPDWAIAFKEGSVKHIYFVAETKNPTHSMELLELDLRGIEKKKTECARKFFDAINESINPKNVKYDVVDSFGKLMEVVGVKAGV